MRKRTSRLSVGVCLAAMCLAFPLSAQEVDGVFQGAYGEQPVSASLNKLEFSLTGMLFVGKKRYILLADDTDSGYAGQLTDLDTGEVSAVELALKGGRLTIKIEGRESPMTFELDKTKR